MADRPMNRGRKARKKVCGFCVDKVVKASYDVKVGDIIEIQFGNKNVRARVTDVKDTVKKEEAKEMFEYL